MATTDEIFAQVLGNEPQAPQEQTQEQQAAQNTQEQTESTNETDNPDLAVSEATTTETEAEEQPTEEEEIILDDSDDLHVDDSSPFAKSKDILGFEVKSLEDVKGILAQKDKEFQEQLSKYKEAQTVFANDELKELNEFVAKGGKIQDFKDATVEIGTIESQLKQVQAVDPIEAYKAYLKDDLGLSNEQIEDHIEQQGEITATIEGKKLIKGWESHLTTQLSQKKSAIENRKLEQQKKYEQLSKGIADAADKMTNILGVSATSSDKALIKQLAAQPLKVVSKYFPVDEQGNYVVETWAKSIATLELAAKKAERLKTHAQSQGAKQTVQGRANVPTNKDPRSTATPTNDPVKALVASLLEN